MEVVLDFIIMINL